ncbi:hypothetical protein F5Y02DRAFT_396368 [Annulohypoxylon stygium]|nr:hypothetical protein F5Y02DRAFT_396368 [Annulohypoxylon stygium]
MVSEGEALRIETQMRGILYHRVCLDYNLWEFHKFVKVNENHPFFPDTTPPKPDPRRQGVSMQDRIEYLCSLVAEADKLTDMLFHLAAHKDIVQDLSDDGKSLEFARCLVRNIEAHVDWDFATLPVLTTVDKAKETLQEGYKPGSMTEDQFQNLSDRMKIWEEKFPPIEAAWLAIWKKHGEGSIYMELA